MLHPCSLTILSVVTGVTCYLSLAAGHWPEAVSSITFRFNFSESCPVLNSPHKGGSTGLFWKLPGTCGISADADGVGRWAADLAGKRPVAAAHCTHSKSAPLCAKVRQSVQWRAGRGSTQGTGEGVHFVSCCCLSRLLRVFLCAFATSRSLSFCGKAALCSARSAWSRRGAGR